MDHGTVTDVRAVSQSRGFPLWVGIEVLVSRGLLRFCHLSDGPDQVRCWAVMDSSGNAVQARRIDGKPFALLASKSKFLAGLKSWPVGAADIGERNIVLLTEGETDLLAAATAAWIERDGDLEDIGFCTMLGAGASLSSDALPHFQGKTVRIFADPDDTGRRAAIRWAKQLVEARAKPVDAIVLDSGRDLSDYVSHYGLAHIETEGDGPGWPDILVPRSTRRLEAEYAG